MPGWIWLFIGLAAVLITFVALIIRDARKTKRRLAAGFGKPPAQPRGLDNAAKFYQSYAKSQPWPGAVDSLTWNDLDMDELYHRLNGCQSAAGDVHLYSVLRRPHPSPAAAGAALAPRQQLMDLFETKPALRLECQYRLARLGRADGTGLEMAVFHAGALQLNRRWFFILMALLPFVGVGLMFVNLTFGILLMGAALIANFNLNAILKNRQDSGFRSVRFLASALSCAKRLAGALQREHPATAGALAAAARPFRASALALFMLQANDIAETSLGFDPFSMLQLPMLAYSAVSRKLGHSGAETLELYRQLGEVDLAAALLSYRHWAPVWCAPTFLPQDSGEAAGFEALCHPLLSEPVPNSVVLSAPVLLTGSNASGKSTFIKAVALALVMAQTLGTCAAKKARLRCGVVCTSMAVEDSIVDGDSYFVAEIKSMRRLVLRQADAPFGWFFIDEILKGTNTVERVAASAAVLRALAGTNCLPLAATHDVELTTMLAAHYQNMHFRETVTQAGVSFDYKLHPGPATTRNAILLLERMDFPQELTHTAHRLVDGFEGKGEWPPLP